MISVIYHQKDSFWDQSLLKDLLSGEPFTEKTAGDGCIFIVAGEYTGVGQINKAIEKFAWVLLVITSDEQSKFNIEGVLHPNVKIYLQYPKQGRHDDYTRIPLGYASHARANLELKNKTLDYFFSGQVTHARRKELQQAVEIIKADPKYTIEGEFNSTPGFSQGYGPSEYMKKMCSTITVPTPAGPVCADSFRTYEALEAGAVPIADGYSPAGDRNYYNYLFDNLGFPQIENYEDLAGYIEDQVKTYPENNNRAQAWWIQYKHSLRQQFIDDASKLSGQSYTPKTTVIVPVSPIKSHPSTEKLQKCIESIRHHLDCEIIITFDGVRPEQEDRRADYEEFIRRALFKCNTEWSALPLIFEDHTHQVGMMHKALEYVTSPTVVYVEGDTGFVLDREIDWQNCIDTILSGNSNLIRFHFEGIIPKEHDSLMIAKDGELIETYQWSQRPHIASTAYYRSILNNHFSLNAKSFIEDKMHGVLAEAYLQDGRPGWLQHRVHIYAPESNLKYSVNFDGREGGEKWDDTQQF